MPGRGGRQEPSLIAVLSAWESDRTRPVSVLTWTPDVPPVTVTDRRQHGLTGSMGRVGACGDNAAMESFFALLQKNVLDQQRWPSREQLRLAIITWIERTYHRRRRQRRLGRLTPIEYETINRPAQAA
jgi:putative transposase